MIKLFFSSFILFLLFGIHSALAAEQCPAINCDCSTLPNQNWVSTCLAHEARIKSACVANSNTPKDYCSIHGLNARPLALAIKFSEFELSASTDVAELNDKISSLYWTITNDTEKAKEDFDRKRYSRSLQILKLVDSNIDNLFQMQQQLESVFVARESRRKASSAWKRYAKKTSEYSAKLQEVGVGMYAQLASAQSNKEKKIFSILAQKTLRMAGKSFELSGYAFGKSNQHKMAARKWHSAADVATELAKINKALGAKKNNIRYAEFQAAARLHRASYHWIVNKNTEYSMGVLKDSQAYLEHDAQKNLDVLIKSEIEREEEGGGILSRR